MKAHGIVIHCCITDYLLDQTFETRLKCCALSLRNRLDHGGRQGDLGVAVAGGIPLLLAHVDHLDLPLLGVEHPALAPPEDPHTTRMFYWTGQQFGDHR